MYGEPSFPDLFDGKIDSLMIAVSLPSTRATRQTPMSGIWRLTRDQFVGILESIKESERFKVLSLAEISHICDEIGPESRFFRLNAAVAAWLDENEPEVVYDYPIG